MFQVIFFKCLTTSEYVKKLFLFSKGELKVARGHLLLLLLLLFVAKFHYLQALNFQIIDKITAT